MTNKLTTLAVTVALVTGACDARTLIGAVPDGSAPDSSPTSEWSGPGVAVGTSGHTCAPLPPIDRAPAVLPPDMAGTWTGHFESALSFLSANVVRLSLQPTPDGEGKIQFVMGAGPPPPPPTSATETYPSSGYNRQGWPSLIEGFSYTGKYAQWAGTKLGFAIFTSEPWQSWCALQTSYFFSDTNDYRCAPTNDNTAACEGTTKTHCDQVRMCGFTDACRCDACGCEAATFTNLFWAIELTFDGDVATGEFSQEPDFKFSLTRDMN